MKTNNFKIFLLISKLTFILLISLHSHKVLSNTIFYQPLSQDEELTSSQWATLLDKVYAEGYREIVIQWTQYGPTNFVTNQHFLKNVLGLATAKNFRIWVGLYLPNDYYQNMANKNIDTRKYFQQLLSKNRKQLSSLEILSLVNNDSFAGWYLPLELTHQYLTPTKEDQKYLVDALESFISTIDETIAVSYFLSENTPLKAAVYDVTQLNNMGFKLWLQKGNGLKKATVANQVITKMGCDIGVIYENFTQTSENNTPFKAEKNHNSDSIKDSIDCQKRLIFSLRYLPYSPLPLG